MLTPVTYTRACDLFDTARTLDRAEREALLDRECNNVPELRTAVLRLLAGDAAAEEERFLSGTSAFGLNVHSQNDPPGGPNGERLGPYQILRQIGRGGMGNIYLAVRTDHYDQQVAIKVLRRGVAGSAMLQRFFSERQILASLNHPNITRLLDGGSTADGRPYLVMEYVEGQPIDKYCDGHGLDVRARVQLFLAVCTAVEHAHSRSLIHRDLKPNNVLVTADGTVKLTDFGLAKHLENDLGHTQTGELLGTPAYMAPEQAAGRTRDVGPQTDVHALGVILYELLSGRTPYRGTSLRDTLEQLCTQEAESLRRLQPKLPRDLETICHKCLQKEVPKRYTTVRELADDVRRFLASEPISARPIGIIERLYRWSRRNPKVAALAASCMFVLIAGFAGVFSMWRLAESRRVQAESDVALAVEAIEKMYTQVAENRLYAEPGMQKVQVYVLQQALELLERLSLRDDSNGSVRFKRAQAYHFVSRIQSQLGQIPEAEQAVRQQIGLLEQLAAEFPFNDRYQFDLFHARRLLGFVLSVDGREADGAEEQSRSLTIIEQLVQDFPDKPNYRDALASQGVTWGTVLRNRNDFEGAEKMFRTSLAIAKALDKAYPEKQTPPYYIQNVASSLQSLALLLGDTGRLDEAEQALREARCIFEQLADSFPSERGHHTSLLSSLSNLAGLQWAKGDLAEAEHFLEQALPIATAIAERSPDDQLAQLGFSSTLIRLGNLYYTTNRSAEALAAFQQSKDLLEKTLDRWPDCIPALSGLGSLLVEYPIPELQDIPRGLRLLEKYMERDPTQPSMWRDLGVARYRAGDWTGALDALEKSIEGNIRMERYTRFVVAMCHWQLGNREQARENLQQAIRWMEDHAPHDPELRRYRGEAEPLIAGWD